ncbi:MAG: hypothetical protein AB3N33_06865 [Puniceicoccaceae bacterium]
MKKHPTLRTIGLTALLLLGLGSIHAQTALVSVNWKQFAGGINDALDGYGVEAANNWHNLQAVTIGTDLTDSSGAATTVDFELVTTEFRTLFDGSLDNTPMRSGALDYPATVEGTTLSLTGLAGTFTSYDLIVYVASFNGAAGGNTGEFSVSGTGVTPVSYFATTPNPFTGSLIQSMDQDSGDGIDSATYVRFSGLTADELLLTATALNGNTGIGGIQLVGTAVPEPSTFAFIGGLLALGFVIQRRLRK